MNLDNFSIEYINASDIEKEIIHKYWECDDKGNFPITRSI